MNGGRRLATHASLAAEGKGVDARAWATNGQLTGFAGLKIDQEMLVDGQVTRMRGIQWMGKRFRWGMPLQRRRPNEEAERRK